MRTTLSQARKGEKLNREEYQAKLLTKLEVCYAIIATEHLGYCKTLLTIYKKHSPILKVQRLAEKRREQRSRNRLRPERTKK